MMFSTLRGRLIASHIIPMLISMPIMGIALIEVLGTQVVLDQITRQFTQQAALIAELAGDYPGLWHSPAEARSFIARVQPILNVRITLFDAEMRPLASGDPAGLPTTQDVQAGNRALSGAGAQAVTYTRMPMVRTVYNAGQNVEMVDVTVPVLGRDQQRLGAIQVSDQLDHFQSPYQSMRSLIVLILLAGFLLSTALGWVLALNLQRPLQQVTGMLRGLTLGRPLRPLPEQDVDEINALVQSINVLVAQLHASEESRHEQLARVVHELGRPLAAMRSAVRALARADDELRRELIGGMDEELQRLSRLLHDLTLLDEQPALTASLNCQQVDLNEWLPDVLAPRRQLALEKGLAWQVNLLDRLPVVSMDPDRMGQALSNILHNAIKFTPPGGAVRVTVGLEDGDDVPAVWMCVADDGPGMTPEQQRMALKPLYRRETARRAAQPEGGLGLGLPITRSLIAAHGGRLLIDSAPGTGTRVTLWLPVLRSGGEAADIPDTS